VDFRKGDNMATAQLHKKNSMIMRFHQADGVHPKNGEKINISFSGVTTVIEYKGRLVTWDIQEMINEAIDLIESEDE
jgi:hypothetical protein